jgi:hypothetical protein
MPIPHADSLFMMVSVSTDVKQRLQSSDLEKERCLDPAHKLDSHLSLSYLLACFWVCCCVLRCTAGLAACSTYVA